MSSTYPDASSEPIVKSDADWRAQLTPERYRALRQHGTGRPGACPLNREKRKGVCTCAECSTVLRVFPDRPRATTGPGYCINGVALKLKPRDG
jgi:peptide-methionine (R)-S-oxide reductase